MRPDGINVLTGRMVLEKNIYIYSIIKNNNMPVDLLQTCAVSAVNANGHLIYIYILISNVIKKNILIISFNDLFIHIKFY